ncbi:hypothetical protein E4U42_007096 [Claviceps africana]|uniref:Uncharacterized protein n=1 Tax=Claviceps africana TaxID=83212 RepID=A0A8K0J1J3_9HYPO|nr:hypothetical protein E4U42_007096 [Claviceps africana]
MGGSAFASPGKSQPLYTPRMPKAVYEHVKAQCHSILREHYIYVASPIDGPAKADFGDIDILVAWPKGDGSHVDGQNQLQAIAKLLGAVDVISKGSHCASNLAIPWPEELDASGNHEGAQPPKTKHIQVDVRVCQTLQTFEWTLLKNAHGDIWNMIGSTIRPYGLTIDDRALWIRIPEVETFNKHKSKIFLTSDPSEVLDFLGLPIDDVWDRPFASLGDMYEYVARCPMFWVRAQDRRGDNADGDETHAAPDPARKTTASSDAQRLKSNDRRRMSKRPAYRRWVDEFIPECRRQGRFLEKRMSREQVTHAALCRFHAGPAYGLRRKEALVERQRELIFRDLIKGTIPPPAAGHYDAQATLFRSCQIKALKSIILQGDATTYGVDVGESFQNEDGFFDLARAADFIAARKDEIGEAAMLVHRRRCGESMAVKAREAK